MFSAETISRNELFPTAAGSNTKDHRDSQNRATDQAYEAATIQEAIRLAQQVTIRLPLIDMVLGDADGLSCARRIKAILPQCRIILISAYPDREFHRQGLQSGAVAFLDKKDLDLSTLRQLIDDVIA